MFIRNEAYKRGLNATHEKIEKAIKEGYDLICNIVKDNGGLLKTPAESGKPFLYAIYDADIKAGPDAGAQSVAIHGLRWDDELGLTLCTDDMLCNYTYDTGYYFDYFYDFEGEDLENLEKALADPAYFVEFDKYDLNQKQTILNLLAGLAEYL